MSRPIADPSLVVADTVTSTATTSATTTTTGGVCRSVQGTFPECPLCGADLFPEHAHFKCRGCGWRDSCCD